MDKIEENKLKYSWGTGIPCSKDGRESAVGGLTDLLVSWICFHHRGGDQTGSLEVSGPQAMARARDRAPWIPSTEWMKG